MHSIERIDAVFEGRAADRVPVFEQSIASSVASEILGRPALVGSTSLHYEEAEVLLRGDDEAYGQFKARVLEDRVALARALHHDALSSPWLLEVRPARKLDEFNFLYGDLDGNRWTIRRYDPTAQTFEVVDSSDRELTIEQVEDQVEECEKKAESASSRSLSLADLEVMCRRWGNEFAIFGSTDLAIPMQADWLEATLTRPDLIRRYMAARVEIRKPSLREQRRLGIRVIWGGGDLAGKNGPFFSPRVFRELVLPYKRALTHYCHQLGLKYVYRTDGNLWPLGDDFFLRCGADGYGEIDQDAGMDPVEVHRRYPNLTLWGGVPSGSVLHLGTRQRVAECARRSIEGTGGRLILGSSNTIVHGTPAENVLAMVETALKSPVPRQ